MKKFLSILLILLVLVGCSEKQSINLDDYKNFKVESNLVAEVYYDEDYNVVYYTITNNDTDEDVELDLNDKTVEESINLILKAIPVEESIKITSDDETVDEIIKTCLEENDLEQEVLLNNEDISINKLLNFNDVGEYGALIYKMYDWQNKRSELRISFYDSYLYDIFVFADDHTGFRVKYVNIGMEPVQTTFTWDDEGVITYDDQVVTGWFNGMELLYYHPFFCSDEDHTHERIEVQEDGTIKDIISVSTNEYMLLEKVDSFEAPWNTKDYINNEVGRTIEACWDNGPEIASVWYEPSFINYSDDYAGVKTYSSVRNNIDL